MSLCLVKQRNDNNDQEHFVVLMDQFMPHWRLLRDELNRAPLAHVEWEY